MNVTIRKNGKSFEMHPFLDDSINERDRAFVRILLDEHPMGAGHGEVLAMRNVVWARMKNYIIFTKKHQKMVPNRPGCDDEKPSDLLELLHQLKKDYCTGVEEMQHVVKWQPRKRQVELQQSSSRIDQSKN
jgi:hypothetical protein